MIDVKDIISIAGKPGLYKVIARSPKSFIVESIDQKKSRFAVSATQQVSLLDEITVYAETEENLALKSIFENIEANATEKPVPSPNDNPVDIRDYFGTVAPGFDKDRVYISDMKKIFKWYELISSGHTKPSLES